MIGAIVKNHAPDADMLVIKIATWTVNVSRGEDGETWVVVIDETDGSETSYILGQEGETQKL